MSSVFDKAKIDVIMPKSDNIDENVFIVSIGESENGTIVSFNDGEGGEISATYGMKKEMVVRIQSLL